MNRFARTFAFFVALASSVAATAQQQTLTLNPGASSVAFGLTGTGHEVHGSFHIASGVITFDRASGKASGSIVVSAASGDSGDKGRDKKMHNDVLDAEHYADVTFQPRSFQGTLAASGDSTIQVAGVFTLHGTPHDLTVPMQIHIDGSNVTAKGSFIVPYVQWGLKDPSIFILKVAKEVHIDLDLSGAVTPAK